MNYKVGDRVKVKSLQWFNENFDDDYNVVFANGWHFSEPMSIFCGKELIIEKISHATNPPHYIMKDNMFAWTDEMIEGLVEEKTLIERVDDNGLPFNEWLSHKGAFHVPDGYELKDENGNVINATKIVLERKEKSYPKTFDECCKVLGLLNVDLCFNADYCSFDASKELWKRLGLMNQFYQLLICRDAYWKIAGEEMGLGKPWKPDWNNISDKYCIYFVSGDALSKECQTRQCPFAFPTPEIRDTFKKNFDPDIEICKELL